MVIYCLHKVHTDSVTTVVGCLGSQSLASDDGIRQDLYIGSSSLFIISKDIHGSSNSLFSNLWWTDSFSSRRVLKKVTHQVLTCMYVEVSHSVLPFRRPPRPLRNPLKITWILRVLSLWENKKTSDDEVLRWDVWRPGKTIVGLLLRLWLLLFCLSLLFFETEIL